MHTLVRTLARKLLLRPVFVYVIALRLTRRAVAVIRGGRTRGLRRPARVLGVPERA